jgi:uncharacterized protein YegJ (DUF2314 family)
MSKVGTSINLVAILVIATFSNSMSAQTISDKAARDDIVNVAKDDPIMLAAMRNARASLPDFLALAAAPPAKAGGFSVKVAVRDHGRVEYFWVGPFEHKGGQFSGRLDNRPRVVRNVTFGETISFAEADIVDWTYMNDGKMQGSYTTCAILKREPRVEAEAMMKQYGLTCDR